MMRFLCDTAEVPAGETRSVRLEGMPELVVCNVDGEFHVLAATCSHGKASLADGRLLGCEVECPLHSGRFDVRTGRATRRPAKRPVAVYECVVEGGDLYVSDPAPVDSDLAVALRREPASVPPKR
ncbi:non-heme iron oxygenase ferredoxin subunit [Pseudonocardia bannensis]|uniref:Non-heme iron oxygenase ferredoxin subunit n=1 Tax=Pseudonocardia bannensis TaxID=630973 RepID=A0A848DHJ1_9PSEU|nr:non-heme iron oxygenase ferredoxin subunit [Pseudonocardia bannensis]NMH92019.1 non-heme iron oxygenase ferredoxin subunit [Pseudonocardia bannensis]